MVDSVLLLDSEIQVIYATLQVEQVMKRHSSIFAIQPRFTLHNPYAAASFAAFTNDKNQNAGPLSLLLEDEDAKGQEDHLLFNCFLLPKPVEPDLHIARYMIVMRDTDHFPDTNWQFFIEQFNLTTAEARCCRLLAHGLTLKDYCKKWNVSISTARSQLHSIFDKTSTHRQSDLLRLIFMFSRI